MAYDGHWHDDLAITRIIRAPQTLVRISRTGTRSSGTRPRTPDLDDPPDNSARRTFQFEIQPKIPADAFNPMAFNLPSEFYSGRGFEVRVTFIVPTARNCCGLVNC